MTRAQHGCRPRHTVTRHTHAPLACRLRRRDASRRRAGVGSVGGVGGGGATPPCVATIITCGRPSESGGDAMCVAAGALATGTKRNPGRMTAAGEWACASWPCRSWLLQLLAMPSIAPHRHAAVITPCASNQPPHQLLRRRRAHRHRPQTRPPLATPRSARASSGAPAPPSAAAAWWSWTGCGLHARGVDAGGVSTASRPTTRAPPDHA